MMRVLFIIMTLSTIQALQPLLLNTTNNHTIIKRSTFKGYGSRGCLDLRSKRYISDGFCTTARPVAEAVCVTKCQESEPFTGSVDSLPGPTTTRLVEWRCTQGATRRKMIRFLCKDGTRRMYQIKLVTKCNCKKVHLENKQSSISSREKSNRKMKHIQ